MRCGIILLTTSLFLAPCFSSSAQNPRDLVSQSVQTEIDASKNDHSRWLYFDVDAKPNETTRQWVAETGSGVVHRVLFERGQPTTPDEQRNAMDRFIHDPSAQAKQRKAGQHDDKQSEDMLRLLPDAFNWTISSNRSDSTVLHFTPNDNFKPPTWEARVFAAMEGDMQISKPEHRIISLKGRLIRDVRFCGGLCGNLHAGGTFDVERRQTGPGVWQITETHVHIHGTILFFKNISEEEDEVKTHFHPLPGNISLEEAETELLKQSTEPRAAETAHTSGTRTASRPPS
jgi:hypothetical protein